MTTPLVLRLFDAPSVLLTVDPWVLATIAPLVVVLAAVVGALVRRRRTAGVER